MSYSDQPSHRLSALADAPTSPTRARGRRPQRAAAALLASVAMLAATGSGAMSAGASSVGRQTFATTAANGVATFAEQPGTTLNWIFPLIPDSYDLTNISQFEDIMWRPLYWLGTNSGEALWNNSLSLAYPPVFSNGNKVVTIKLKHYLWSNGKPVTSRDVEFWILLMKAAIKINPGYWGGYVKGYFPDNVLKVGAPNPSTVVLDLNKGYDDYWYWYNELSQITPIPQAAWDKESASGAVGNYDLTPSGATKVYDFLAAQSKDLSTYVSNPLWKVVDGPWTLTGFTTTSRLTFAPNPTYSGPVKPALKEFIEEPFTSDAAEFNALEAGDLTYGYVPFTDVSAINGLKSNGYTIAPWEVWAVNYNVLNFNNPKVGKLFDQLYIRQAMQLLVDQPLFVKAALYGYGTPTYGVIPDDIPSSYLTRGQASSNPYPYNPAKAVQLLRSHGWKVIVNGSDVCERPGNAAGDCGAGIAAGTQISFKMLYASGFQYLNVEMQAYKTAMDQAGMRLSLSEAPVPDVLGSATPCSPSQSDCGWQMLNWEFGYVLVPNYDPTGEQQYEAGAASNFGSFNSPVLNALIQQTNLPGGSAHMGAYAKLAAQQLPDIFWPEAAYQISAIRASLHGALPQNPEEDFTPENWRLGG